MSLVVIVFLVLTGATYPPSTAGECSSALGLQDSSIPDSALTASSVKYSSAAEARLNRSGGWATEGYGQWLQLALGNVTNITAIATQGHSNNGWTERYLLYSSLDGKHWQPYDKELRGNADRNTVVKRELDRPIVARFLRIYPRLTSSPALRLELYGCAAGATYAPSAAGECSSPLGLQNHSVPDSALNASSAKKGPAAEARLNSSGGWATDGDGQWLQLALGNVTNITAIATQGHSTSGWTERYLLYSSLDEKHWQPYDKELLSNADRNTVIKQKLDPSIVARFLRIYPLGNAALRLELYGCGAAAPAFLTVCVDPAGLENKTVRDSAISASSSFDGNNGRQKARLHMKEETINGTCYRGWRAAQNDAAPWLQINLTRRMNITGIATQGGRYGCSQFDAAWVKSYSLSYSLEQGQPFHKYHDGKIFNGNADEDTVVWNQLEPSLTAKSVRINPKTNLRAVVMRVELHGCAEATTPSSSPQLVTTEASDSPTSPTPTPMGGPLEEFTRIMKDADPKNKSSIQAVVNAMAKLITTETKLQDVDLLSASEEIETFALKHATIHLQNGTEMVMTFHSENLVLQIRKMTPTNSINVRIPELDSTENKAFTKLPPDTFGNESALLVAIVYSNMKAVLGQTVESKFELNPNIIAVSAKSKQKKLKKKVRIVFNHPEGVAAVPPQCVFWRPHRFKPGGKWSKTGCSLASWTSSQTECLCDHLTSFTILMPVQNEIHDADKLAMTIITGFGMSLSIVAEILISLSFFLFSDVSDPRSQVRANLAGALMAGQIVFLAGIRSTSNAVLCAAVALLLQYFYVAAFCWMSAEAFMLYVHVVQAFLHCWPLTR